MGRRGTRRQTLTELEDEVMTCETGSSSLELDLELDGSFRVGRWITDKDEIREVNFSGTSLSIDITFILEQEKGSQLPEVTTQDSQKVDNAEAPTHLWSFFFKESFLLTVSHNPWEDRKVGIDR